MVPPMTTTNGSRSLSAVTNSARFCGPFSRGAISGLSSACTST